MDSADDALLFNQGPSSSHYDTFQSYQGSGIYSKVCTKSKNLLFNCFHSDNEDILKGPFVINSS